MPERMPSHFEDEDLRRKEDKPMEKPGPRLVPTPSRDGGRINPKDLFGHSETADSRVKVGKDQLSLIREWQEQAAKETEERMKNRGNR